MRYTAGDRRLLRDTGKRRLMKDEQEKSAADLLDCAGIYLSGAGHLRDRSADSAYSALLYGNGILLRKKFEKASRLVYRNRSVSETPGQLCEAEGHDNGDKAAHCRNRDRCNGCGIYYDEQSSGGTDLHCHCVGMSSDLFFRKSQNSKNRKLNEKKYQKTSFLRMIIDKHGGEWYI